ncbi:hypothetical protein CDIK_3131 [Cucumispora dikerogammari]|nr:hypothetical protein CDIK_3131 [Cucumispora dikerogammari]
MDFLKQRIFCKECRKMMTLKEKKADSLRWRCLAKRCLKREIRIKKILFFFGLRLSLKTIAMILYLWSRDTPIKNIIHELKVSFDGVKSILDIIRSKLKQQE